jgi:hypothetical protein
MDQRTSNRQQVTELAQQLDQLLAMVQRLAEETAACA